MDRRRAMRAVVAALLTGALIMAAAGTAAGDPQTDKAQVDRQLAQARVVYEAASAQAQAALETYNETSQRLTVAQGNLAEANGVVAARHAESAKADSDAHSARAAQDAADQRYVDAGARVDQTQGAADPADQLATVDRLADRHQDRRLVGVAGGQVLAPVEAMGYAGVVGVAAVPAGPHHLTVGSTGASTGAHLHIEVRLNGTPVQPLNWLDACIC